MNRQPVILIASEHGFSSETHTDQFVLNKNYSRAISGSGGVPIIAADPNQADSYAEMYSGLLLTGGTGVHPARYNDVFFDDDSIRGTNAIRDAMEFELLYAFASRRKPVFGICRGHQLINVAFGGKLMLNFPKQLHLEHQNWISHNVVAEEGSILGRLFGLEFETNSNHRDCVTEVGNEMAISARSKDGIVEGIEHKTLPIFGVQWHPERSRGELKYPPKGPDMSRLFDYFIQLCSQSIRPLE